MHGKQRTEMERERRKENEKVTPAGVAHLIEILITAAPVNG